MVSSIVVLAVAHMMTISKTTVVLAEHEIGNIDCQVLVPDAKKVPLHQNPNHPVEPLEWTATKSGKEGGRLIEMTRRPGAETIPSPQKLETWTLVLKPSILGRVL